MRAFECAFLTAAIYILVGPRRSSGDESDAISLPWVVQVRERIVLVAFLESIGSHKAAASCVGDQWQYLGQDLDSLLQEKQT